MLVLEPFIIFIFMTCHYDSILKRLLPPTMWLFAGFHKCVVLRLILITLFSILVKYERGLHKACLVFVVFCPFQKYSTFSIKRPKV